MTESSTNTSPEAARQSFDRMVVSNFLKLGAGEVLSRLLGFAGTIIIARQLGVESYAVVGLGFAVLLYFAAVGDLGMEQLGPREVANEEEPLASLASTMTVARVIASAIIALVLAAIGLLFVTEPEGQVLALYGLALIAMGASTRWVHVGLGGMGTVAVSRFLIEALRVGLLLLLVREPADLFRVPIIQFAGEAAGTMLLWVALRHRGVPIRWSVDTSLLRTVLRRGLPLLITNLLALVIYNVDIIVLRIFRDRAEVGLYLAAYTLLNFLGVLGNTATLSILPSLSKLRRATGRGVELMQRAQAQMAALGLPIAVGGALLAAPILTLVFGDDYAPAAPVLVVLVVAIPLIFERAVLQAVLISAGRQDRVLRATAWSAGLTIGANLGLIPLIGMMGAAIATVASELIRLVLSHAYVQAEGYPRVTLFAFWRPVFAAGLMTGALFVLGDRSILLLVPVGALVYGTAFAVTGGLRLFTTPVPVERAP